jgi:hypothetical protein
LNWQQFKSYGLFLLLSLDDLPTGLLGLVSKSWHFVKFCLELELKLPLPAMIWQEEEWVGLLQKGSKSNTCLRTTNLSWWNSVDSLKFTYRLIVNLALIFLLILIFCRNAHGKIDRKKDKKSLLPFLKPIRSKQQLKQSQVKKHHFCSN